LYQNKFNLKYNYKSWVLELDSHNPRLYYGTSLIDTYQRSYICYAGQIKKIVYFNSSNDFHRS